MDLDELVIQPGFWQDHLTPVFRPHVNLTKLTLHPMADFTFFDLRPDDIPNLRELSSGLEQAAHLIPGRPVVSLKIQVRWFPDWDLQVKHFKKIGLSRGPLRELEMPVLGTDDLPFMQEIDVPQMSVEFARIT